MIELNVLSKADVEADGQPKFWRSQAHLEDSAEHRALREGEFLPGAADPSDLAGDPGPSRRSFIKIMGASMALAGVGLSGCRRPVEEILPYVRKPEEVVPGVPNFYATAMPTGGGYVQGLLVESHEGRPTKVEGNPEHPMNRGATDVFAQASILNLYDPDRSQRMRLSTGSKAGWADFVAYARRLSPETRLAVLAEPTSSPTVLRLREQLLARFPGARWLTYRSAGEDTAALGMQEVAGRPLRPLYRFSQARTIVSFDADFLSGPGAVFHSREFARSRRVESPEDGMSRLYVLESAYTPTGGMADHRKRMKAGLIPFYAAAVAAALGVPEAGTAGSAFAEDPFVEAIAEDARRGGAVFLAGPTQPPAVHALCARLNALHAEGAVEYLETGAEPAEPQAEALRALVEEMKAGQVDLLVVIGANPAYDAPPALGFAEALGRVPTSIHLGLHLDETARLASWHIPRAHYLEQWGDGRAYDGTYSVIQPLIAPLYEDARSEVELLSALATGEDVSGYDLVRETVREGGFVTGSFEDGWRRLLHDGFAPGTAFPAGAAEAGASGSVAHLEMPEEGALEVVIRPDPRLGDGAFSNNAWMLELPDPVTKVTWDNVAQMSRATAERLGLFRGFALKDGHQYAPVVALSVGGQRVELPVWVQPGHPDDSVTVTLGYGRQIESERAITDRGLLARLFDYDADVYRPGPMANGVGANVALLRGIDGAAVLPEAEIEVVGEGYLLATTQDHGSMEGRPIVRMATLEEYRQRPNFAREQVEPLEGTPWEQYPPLWGEENAPPQDPRIGEALYAEQQWAMAIDLNACSGCNACIVACQSENNVPVVGKDQVARGREMHWLRMDRYYVSEGTSDVDEMAEPGMVMQPMLCQHCEYAPCEPVCPVAATSHSPDGLNEMTYNRCIGTRYCSNNCPYKVRRFNYYNWTKTLPIQTQMAMNPDVTVRFRGVMEKCTFCVQRIRSTQRLAHMENRPVEDGEVVTACQQACPSEAIVFGNLLDPNSRVSQLRRADRRYEVLEELLTKPRVSYLARLRNPNPRLEAALAAAPSA